MLHAIVAPQIAQLADGFVVARQGGTVVMVSAVSDRKNMDESGFLPLSVEYREKVSSSSSSSSSSDEFVFFLCNTSSFKKNFFHQIDTAVCGGHDVFYPFDFLDMVDAWKKQGPPGQA